MWGKCEGLEVDFFSKKKIQNFSTHFTLFSGQCSPLYLRSCLPLLPTNSPYFKAVPSVPFIFLSLSVKRPALFLVLLSSSPPPSPCGGYCFFIFCSIIIICFILTGEWASASAPSSTPLAQRLHLLLSWAAATFPFPCFSRPFCVAAVNQLTREDNWTRWLCSPSSPLLTLGQHQHDCPLLLCCSQHHHPLVVDVVVDHLPHHQLHSSFYAILLLSSCWSVIVVVVAVVWVAAAVALLAARSRAEFLPSSASSAFR